jgi:hypothetical protein
MCDLGKDQAEVFRKTEAHSAGVMHQIGLGFGARKKIRRTNNVELTNPNLPPQDITAADLLQSFTICSENPTDDVAALVHHVIFRGH